MRLVEHAPECAERDHEAVRHRLAERRSAARARFAPFGPTMRPESQARSFENDWKSVTSRSSLRGSTSMWISLELALLLFRSPPKTDVPPRSVGGELHDAARTHGEHGALAARLLDAPEAAARRSRRWECRGCAPAVGGARATILRPASGCPRPARDPASSPEADRCRSDRDRAPTCPAFSSRTVPRARPGIQRAHADRRPSRP